MRIFKTWKKYGKPGKNFEKTSGNAGMIQFIKNNYGNIFIVISDGTSSEICLLSFTININKVKFYA